MRIAYASPLPPQRTGIADYSAELLPHLARHATVELAVDPGAEPAPALIERFPVHPLTTLGERLASGAVDLALYHLGNNHLYHAGIHRTLLEHPGVVVLHEYMLHHLIRAVTLDRGDPEAYVEEHRYCHGRTGEAVARRCLASGLPFDRWSYPLFERVVDRSLGVIVHNDHARRRILASRPGARVETVPMLLDRAALPAEPAPPCAVRRRLGLPEKSLVVGSFGFITPAKRLQVILPAFARLRRSHPEAVLLLAGEVSPHYELDALLEGERGRNVHRLGRLPMGEFLEVMAATDIAVNLRHPTAGETSATLMRLLGLGVPTLITHAGAFREIPDGCAAKIDLDEQEGEMVAATLEALAADPELRRRMGRAARRHVETHHTPERAASGYARFLEAVLADPCPPAPAVPPLAPSPPSDLFAEVVGTVSAAATDLGVDDGELLSDLARRLVDLDLDRPGPE